MWEKIDFYAEIIGHNRKAVKSFSEKLSKVTPEDAEKEAEEIVLDSSNEFIPDTDSEDNCGDQSHGIYLNPDIFGSQVQKKMQK